MQKHTEMGLIVVESLPVIAYLYTSVKDKGNVTVNSRSFSTTEPLFAL